jgi:putative GTP pyrophosphokinase
MTPEDPGVPVVASKADRGQVLEDAREQWVREENDNDAFGRAIAERLENVARRTGIKASVSYRVKSIDSLIKKLVRKPHHTYATLGDKIGARVVVRHRREVDEIVRLLDDAFLCSEPDDKSDLLGDDRVGYQSVHVEVRLRDGDPDVSRFPPALFCAELQIRTLAQHLWSEMSHDVTYKGGLKLPRALRRGVHLLAGLIEVADNEFSRLERELIGLSDMPEITILEALERQYYRLTSHPSDRALSLEVIRLLRPLYAPPPADWSAYFFELLREKQAFLREVFDMAKDSPGRSAFFFQPEVLMIYDQLHRNPYRLREAWAQEYPEHELERIATAFGVSFA